MLKSHTHTHKDQPNLAKMYTSIPNSTFKIIDGPYMRDRILLYHKLK